MLAHSLYLTRKYELYERRRSSARSDYVLRLVERSTWRRFQLQFTDNTQKQ